MKITMMYEPPTRTIETYQRLGGILETTRRDTDNKVPYLGDIPIFGHLFKSTIRVNNKNELLIFVTPKILREGVKVN